MRAVVQRVLESAVTVDGEVVGQIGRGVNVLVGIHKDDTDKDIAYLAEKLVNLRIFEDEHDVMNLSIQDIGGEALIISQFTLMGDVRKGRRPSYSDAGRPEAAQALFQKFVDAVSRVGIPVATGVFQADMKVSIVNDGPVTILLDSQKLF